MAKVYLAVAEEPAAERTASAGESKLVVLKAMQEDLALDPDLVAMFEGEARLAARLRHPNVVETLEVAELLGRPTIVMEYLEGEPLSRVLYAQEGRQIPRAIKLQIVAAALEGLEYIHGLEGDSGAPIGLVHRDVSPHNIFVTFDGRVKVLDFGIAKGLGSNSRTREGGLKGKIRYMAPEQMEGAAVDRRADVFSVGVILWEIATGQRLWQSRSEVNVMRTVLTEGVPAPQSASPSVPSELNDLCVRALAPSPADRFQTAAELREAILRLPESAGATLPPKDVGELVARAFAEKREHTRGIIAAQLARRDTPLLSRERFGLPVHLPSLATATTSGSAGGAVVSPQRSPRPRSRVLLVTLAVAAVGVAFLGFGARGGLSDGPPGAIPASRQAASIRPPSRLASSAVLEGGTDATPPHGSVHVHLAATPASAVLYLDGVRLASNPFEGDYPSDPAGHTVRAEAPGFVTSAAGIVLEDDVKLALPLSPAKIAGIPRHARADELPPRAAPSPVVSSAPAKADSPNPDCSPPFYFDAQGIKRLKPDCI